MAEPLVLSGSSLQTYHRCPKWWKYEYVVRDERPPSLKAARGLAAHEALEADLQAKVDTGKLLPEGEVLQTFTDVWTRESEHSLDPKGERDKTYQFGLDALALWHQTVAPTIDPVLVEVNGQFVINEVHFEWTADLLDRQGILRDHKFTAKRPPKDSTMYDWNMAGYLTGLRMDHEVNGVQLDYMVCNTKPYHWPVPLVIEEADIDRFGEAVRDAYDDIMDMRFPARPSRRHCSWCPYSDGTCKEGSR